MRWKEMTAAMLLGLLALVANALAYGPDDGSDVTFPGCVDLRTCDPKERDDCPRNPCRYGDCTVNGTCACYKCWDGHDCGNYICQTKTGDGEVVKHRAKRATVTLEDKMKFTLTKSTTATTLKFGQRVDFTLKIQVPPKSAEKLLVEVFAPNNVTTIMMLYDVRIISVGSKINNRDDILKTEIVMDSKPAEPMQSDRAILNFPDVTCCTGLEAVGASVTEADVTIEVGFSSAMYSSSAATGVPYWVSAGAEYDGEREIWVGQSSFQLDSVAATGAATPQFEIVKPAADQIKIGAPFELKLKMKINNPITDPLSVDVIAPLQTTSIVSACAILVSKGQDAYENFKCVTQAPFQSTAYPDSDGRASGRARLEMGRIINVGVDTSGACSPITDTKNTIELSVYLMFVNAPLGKAVVGTSYSIGMAVEVGSTQIWAGTTSVTPTTEITTFENNITPNVYLKPMTSATYGPGSIVTYDMAFEVPNTAILSKAAQYKIEAIMPVNTTSSKAQLGICRMEISYRGWNVPCVVPPNDPVFTKQNPLGLNDRGVWDLGPLVNMNGALNDTNSTANEVHVRIYVTVAKDVPQGTDLGITLGLYIGDKRLWVSESQNITTGAATPPSAADAVQNAPAFGLNYTFDNGVIPLNAVTAVALDIKTKRGKEYGMMDLEIMMPHKDNQPLVKMCRAEVTFGGKNLPCFDKLVANETIEYKDRSAVRDRALLSIGQTCNTGTYNADNEDKIIVRALIKVISGVQAQTQYSAGVMYSTSTIWVGQTSLNVGTDTDAKLNTTHPNLIGMYVDPDDGVATSEAGLCKRYIIKLKLPPQSRSLYTIRASTTSDGIVCAMRFLWAGMNYECEEFTANETRIPDPVISEDRKTAELSLGVVTNPIFDPPLPGNETDNTTIEIEMYVTTKVGAHAYTVELEYQGPTTTDKKTVALSVTGVALAAYTTPPADKPTINLINAKWVDPVDALADNNVIKGQAVRLIYEATIKSNSRNKMFLTVSTSVASVMDFTNIGIQFQGSNLPCVLPPIPPYDISSTGGSTNDTIKVDLGVVKHLDINDTDPEGNILRVEVVGRIRLTTTHSGAIPIKFKTDYDSLSDENDISLSLIAGDTYTDVDSTANVSLTFDSVTSPFNVKPGEFYTVQITATIPQMSSTKTTVDCEAPFVDGTKHAKAVVTDMKVLSSGANLAGMHADAETLETRFSMKNDIQNSRGILDLGVVTNTGFATRIHNTTNAEDDQFKVECTYHVADEDSMNAGQTFPMSVGLKYGSYIVITDLTNTIVRTNTEKPLYTLNATLKHPPGTKFSRGGEIEAELRFAHTHLSKAEGKEAIILVFLPPYLEYMTSPGTTNTTGRLPDVVPTVASPPENYLKFQWARYLFPENTTLVFKLRVKADAHLPSNVENDRVSVPIDFGSKMKDRTSNTDSTKYLPTANMSFLSFDVQNIPLRPKPGGATCTPGILGMQSGVIKDCQLSSSEESLTPVTEIRPGKGWSPFVRGGKLKEGRYVQVYLGPQAHAVSKVTLMRESVCKVTQIRPRYSTDGGGWLWGDKYDLTWTGSSHEVTINSPTLNYLRIYLFKDDCAEGDPVTLTMELHGCNTATTPQPFQCPPVTNYNTGTPSPDSSLRSIVSTGTHMIFCDVIKFSNAGKDRQCFRHLKDGTTFKFTRLSKVVVAMLGYDTVNSELYGVAKDDKAYLISKDSGKTWYAIPKERWDLVKDLATTKKAVKVPWQAKSQLSVGASPRYVVDNYGADFNGIKYKSGNTWSTIVDWSSY